jgi:hypothetical protein
MINLKYEVVINDYRNYILAIEWLSENVDGNCWYQTDSKSKQRIHSSENIIKWLHQINSNDFKRYTHISFVSMVNEIFVLKNKNDAIMLKLKFG